MEKKKGLELAQLTESCGYSISFLLARPCAQLSARSSLLGDGSYEAENIVFFYIALSPKFIKRNYITKHFFK